MWGSRESGCGSVLRPLAKKANAFWNKASCGAFHVIWMVLETLSTSQLLSQVLFDVLRLPIGDTYLLERRARRILHEEVGRCSLGVGDLKVCKSTRLLLDCKRGGTRVSVLSALIAGNDCGQLKHSVRSW